MTRLPLLRYMALAGLGMLALTGCSDEPEAQPSGFNRPGISYPRNGPPAPPSTTTTQLPPNGPAPADSLFHSGNDAAPPPIPPAPVVTQDYPYATPVPGKVGFVTSPYAPEAGFVDVREMSPGQQARDPYTGKIFLVP